MIIVVVFLFSIGLAELFRLRFEHGDVYQAYSSYRADPLGTKALYSSLASLPQITVARNLRDLTKASSDMSGNKAESTALVILGASHSDDPEELIQSIESFIMAGGRLVVTFYPTADEPKKWLKEEPEEEESDTGEDEDEDAEDNAPEDDGENEDSGAENGEDEEESDEEIDEDSEDEKELWFGKVVSIGERWGFKFKYEKLVKDETREYGSTMVSRVGDDSSFPVKLTWHTALFFDECEPEWSFMYTRDDKAVLMSRPWGKGEIILSSDSYLVSNEALRKERYPALLAWLIGPSKNIVFDETHLGVSEQPGIMALMRKYKLHGVFVSIIIVAALFVWRNSASLVPKQHSQLKEEAIISTEGRGAAAGLANLLRRNISSKDALGVCLYEWNRSLAASHKDSSSKRASGKRARIETIIELEASRSARNRDLEKAYKEICKIVAERD